MKGAAHHFDSVKASIESVFFEFVEPDRIGQHDCRDREPDHDRGHDQCRGNRIDRARWCFGHTERAIDDRRSAVRDVADRHDDDMRAGADQREGDDDPQDIAVGQHAPESDQDQGEARGQNDGRDHRLVTPPMHHSGPKPVDDDAEFAADLDAQQDGKQRDCSRTEKRTELAERQHPIVQKSAGERSIPQRRRARRARPRSTPCCSRKSRSSRCCGSASSRSSTTRRNHRPALEASACGQVTVHDDIGRENRRSAGTRICAPVRTISLACRWVVASA